MRRSAVYKNHNSLMHKFGVIALYYFPYLICPVGFSLTQWYTDTGYTPATPLTGDALIDLMEELDLFQHLNDQECDITAAPYFPRDTLGWNIGRYNPKIGTSSVIYK